MEKLIDACGLTCPAPVLLVKDAIEQGAEQEITVLVDNGPSSENVTRFLTTKGYQVKEAQVDGMYRLEARLDAGAKPVNAEQTAPVVRESAEQKVLVLIVGDSLGSGDQILGQKLMVNYINTLKEMGPALWQLIFVNSGVKLTIDTSPVLSVLQEYEKAGVIVFACGTCLEHFGLTAQKKVGGTTNMLDIVMATQFADKVITIG